MPNATVRANAPASPKSAKPAPASPAPKAEPSKDGRIIAAEIIAEVDLNARIKQIQADIDLEAHKKEAEKDAEKAKYADAERFDRAYYAWLTAKAAIEEPAMDDDLAPERFKVEAEAERRFMTMPAVYGHQVWTKFQAFEEIFSKELVAGPRTESILFIALGSIKQDIINLDLCEGGK
jgi:hypothetical protein